ncbi:MAG: hypothetical protein QOG96_6281 [Pseudonocardiales bacterium]|jgi:hypothetical protein|nr:hypothetical protein [Pseudonocardiales bacterium]
MAPIEPSRQLTRLTSAEVGDQTRTRRLDMSRQVIMLFGSMSRALHIRVIFKRIGGTQCSLHPERGSHTR